MFQINQASGALSEVPGSPFAAPTSGPNTAPTSPISITAESSAQFLFVGYFNGSLAGESAITSLAINTSGANPVLNPIQSQEILGAPIQLITDPKGQHLYAGLSQGPNGAVNGGAIVFSIDSSTGLLLNQGTADTLPSNGSSYAIDPRDRFFFASGHDFLQSCLILPVDGTATNCAPLLFLDSANNQVAMIAENSGQFLYLFQSGAVPGVVAYSVNQTTGALTQVLGPFTAIQFANGSAVADPIGPYIYSAQFATTTFVHAYQVDQQTGNLTEITGSPFSSGGTGNCCGGLAISGAPSQAISGPAVSIFPSAANFSAVVGTTSPTQIFSMVNTGNQLLATGTVGLSCSGAPLGAVCQVPANVYLPMESPRLSRLPSRPADQPFCRRPLRLPPGVPVPQMPLSAPIVLALLLWLATLAKDRCLSQLALRKNRLVPCGVLSAAILCITFAVSGCGGGSAAVTNPPPAHRHSLRHFHNQHLPLHHLFLRPAAPIAAHPTHANRQIAQSFTLIHQPSAALSTTWKTAEKFFPRFLFAQR